jgi:predicted NBD/HSP70 family sugar kinase
MDADGLIAIARDVLAGWSVNPATLDGVGVSAAAVVDEKGTIVRAENIGWRHVQLGRLLADAVGRRTVIDTDVFCGALFETLHGRAQGVGSAIYISVGTGVGHALILDGKVWRGAARGANAMGHMVVRIGGARCYCGNAGCLCSLASGLAQSAEPPAAGAIEALAQAIGSAVTLIEPDLVILAGGALDQPWFDLAALQSLLPLFSYPGLTLPLVVKSDVADSNLRGAALLVKEHQ